MITTRPTKLILLFSILFVAIACQDEQVQEETESVDKDMITAIELSEGYLNEMVARLGSSEQARSEDDDGNWASITVLKLIDGELMFDTNTDDYSGYQKVEETTVTAYASPGEFIFWYSGEGVSDLDDIDFDEFSLSKLDREPDEIYPQLLWVVRMPELDDEDEVVRLKYDIVYETENSAGPIRLDPLIDVAREGDDTHVSEE